MITILPVKTVKSGGRHDAYLSIYVGEKLIARCKQMPGNVLRWWLYSPDKEDFEAVGFSKEEAIEYSLKKYGYII